MKKNVIFEKLLLSFMWMFFSAIMAAILPLAAAPFYFFYCFIQYDSLPIVGSEGWFLSHFFASFSFYYKWSAISIGGIYLLGQLVIPILPRDVPSVPANTNLTMNGKPSYIPPPPSVSILSPPSITPSERVWVRAHWRRK